MSKPPSTPDTRDPKAVAIGLRIAALRTSKEYTQEELAAKIGVTPGAIAQYETGRNRPKIERLEALAVELETTTEWLMAGDDINELSRAQTHNELTMLKILRAIPVAQQDTALAILQAIHDKGMRR